MSIRANIQLCTDMNLQIEKKRAGRIDHRRMVEIKEDLERICARTLAFALSIIRTMPLTSFSSSCTLRLSNGLAPLPMTPRRPFSGATMFLRRRASAASSATPTTSASMVRAVPANTTDFHVVWCEAGSVGGRGERGRRGGRAGSAMDCGEWRRSEEHGSSMGSSGSTGRMVGAKECVLWRGWEFVFGGLHSVVDGGG